jgi:hypothetical protein
VNTQNQKISTGCVLEMENLTRQKQLYSVCFYETIFNNFRNIEVFKTSNSGFYLTLYHGAKINYLTSKGY